MRPAPAGRATAGLFAARGARVALGAFLALGLAAAAVWWFRAPLGSRWRGFAGGGPARPDVLVVGIGDGGAATIGEALARARPGQTVEVAPGRYRERIVLREGVSLVSRAPRGAVLLPPAAGAGGAPGEVAAGGGAAITAQGVHGARLSGFRIVADPRVPWQVGVRLDGSEVAVEEVEVSGAAVAGFEIRGADRSTVRLCYIHHNAGPGIVLGGEAASRLLANLIAGNGFRPGGAATGAPGVEVRDGASPLVAENRIEGNSGGGVTLASPERTEEIYRWNTFGALSREQAVRVGGAPTPGGSTFTAPAAPAASAAGPARGGAARSAGAHVGGTGDVGGVAPTGGAHGTTGRPAPAVPSRGAQ